MLPARTTDPVTSHMAAERVEEFQGTMYQKILKALEHGPGTMYEIAKRIGCHHSQIHKRLTELQRKKLIYVPTDARELPVMWMEESGRYCRVWELKRG